MQRNATLAVPFGTRDLRTAETAGAGNANALGAQAKRRLNRALHRAAEGDAALKLVGDALGDELGVNFGLADLDDVEANLGARHALKLFLELLDVRALLADDHAGTRGIDANAADLRRTLDHHLRDRGLWLLLDDVATDLEVLEEQTAIVLAFRVPAAVPGAVDLQAKPDRRGFLTHVTLLPARERRP